MSSSRLASRVLVMAVGTGVLCASGCAARGRPIEQAAPELVFSQVPYRYTARSALPPAAGVGDSLAWDVLVRLEETLAQPGLATRDPALLLVRAAAEDAYRRRPGRSTDAARAAVWGEWARHRAQLAAMTGTCRSAQHAAAAADSAARRAGNCDLACGALDNRVMGLWLSAKVVTTTQVRAACGGSPHTGPASRGAAADKRAKVARPAAAQSIGALAAELGR